MEAALFIRRGGGEGGLYIGEEKKKERKNIFWLYLDFKNEHFFIKKSPAYMRPLNLSA